ncbi:hypothetical protein JCM9279_005818 [Rhodotorula babjevae]
MAAPATGDRSQGIYSAQPGTRPDPAPPPLPPRTTPPAPPPQPASWFSPSTRPASSYGSPPAPPPRPPPALEPFVNPAYPVLRTLPPRTSSHRDFRTSAAPLASAFEQRQPPAHSLTSADRRTAGVGSSPALPPPPPPQARASTFALGGPGPVTPRAPAHERDGDSTPRGSRDAAAADATPRSWAPSTSSAFGAHTPPMLLPRQFSSSNSPHPSSSRTWLDVDTAAAAAAALSDPALDQDDRHSAASSSSSRHAPYSSEDDDNAWAGTLLPSGSSPIQSPLLADGPAGSAPPFPPALAALEMAPTQPGDRPLSEFDWAAAYADSRSPSLLQGVAGPSPFPSPGEGPGAARGPPLASPPLPPLPVEAMRLQGRAGLGADEEEGAREAREDVAAEEERARPVLGVDVVQPPPNPTSSLSPSHGPPILSTTIPSSSFSTPSVSPSSPPRAPLSSASSHPDLASATLLVPAGGAPSSSSALDRPSSRTSLRSATSATSGGRRSPGPQPPRPARRQASALSLRSTASASGVIDDASLGATAAALAAGVSAVVPVEAEQSVALAAQAEGAGPAAAASSASAAPSAVPLPPASSPAAAASSSAAPAAALALSSPRLRTARSPAPSVPEKSSRRMSRRLSVLGGSPGPGSPVAPSASGEGTASARASPRIEQGTGGQAGEAANRFSVPYSISDLALAYGRDSWAEYSVASESDYPPSTRSPAATHAAAPSFGDVDGRGPVGEMSSLARQPASVVTRTDLQQAQDGERADLRVDVAVAPATLPARDGGAGSPSTPTRGDAKARAAAFLADLRRAKAAAAADEADEVSLAVLAAPAAAVSAAERLVSSGSPLPAEVKSFFDSASPALPPLPTASPPARPEPPQAPSLVEPPVPAQVGELEPPSPESSPPVPPPNDSKRPSVASAATTLSIRRRSSTGQPALAAPGPAAAVAATAAPRPVDHTPLLRRRPLPQAVQITAELRRARTARERGRIYAEKINELGRERSRLDEWVAAVGEGRGPSGRPPPAASPNPSTSRRASRQDASTATFAPRGDGHGYRAKELPSSSFGPRDMAPTNAPYPGVLGYNGGGGVGAASSTSSFRSVGAPPSSFSSGSKASFFSGLGVVGRGSLGRRASKREHHGHHGAGAGATMTISAPVQLLSSTNLALTSPTSTSVTPIGGGVRSISGPRMPNASSSTERASLDARYSPSGSPALPSSAPPPLPVRTSFSYGSSASLGAGMGGGLGGLAASASVPAHLSGGMGGGDSAYGALDEDHEDDKLVRLQDILPQASREDLVDALARAGGDDVLAISVYLSGRQGQL